MDNKGDIMLSKHYTLVVTKKALGLYWHVRLKANYKHNFEEILMHSQNYYHKGNAVRAARTLFIC